MAHIAVSYFSKNGGCEYATITGLKAGTATITVTVAGKKSASCKVTVKDGTVTLNESSVTLDLGKQSTKTAKLKCTTDLVGGIKWKSSDKSIVKVSSTGKNATITGLKAGTATITVTVAGKTSASCKVTVTD